MRLQPRFAPAPQKQISRPRRAELYSNAATRSENFSDNWPATCRKVAMTLEDAITAGRHFLHYEEPFDRDFVVLETTRGWLLYEEAIDRKALIGGGAMLFVARKSGKARYYGGGELEYVTDGEPGFFQKFIFLRCDVWFTEI